MHLRATANSRGPLAAALEVGDDRERSMVDRQTDGPFIPDTYDLPEAALGGADAVEKTTYVTGCGTEPETMKPPHVPEARVPPGGGTATTWSIVALLLLTALLVYFLGAAR
jgi:hypothetical protein